MMSSATNCYRLVYCPPYKILRHEVNYHHIITKYPMTKFLSLFALHPRRPCRNTKSYPNRPPSTPDVPTRHAPPQRWQVVKFHEATPGPHWTETRMPCAFMAELRCQLKMTSMHPPTHGISKSVPLLANTLLPNNSTLQPNESEATATKTTVSL
jgi:hypothetical protein